MFRRPKLTPRCSAEREEGRKEGLQQINNINSHLIHTMIVNVYNVIKIIKTYILITFYTVTIAVLIKCELMLLICCIIVRKKTIKIEVWD
jgi:hypothetical protein